MIDTIDPDTIPAPPTPAPALAVDQTGGMTVFMEILREKTSANRIISPPTGGTAESLPAPAQRQSEGLLRRTLGRLKGWAREAVKTVKEGLAWLASGVPNPRLIERHRNRRDGYKGRHHVQRAWYGRQLSTASAVAITRERHRRAQQTSRTKEGALSSYYELPEYWVSHLAALVQSLRDDHAVMHPGAERHWQCQ